MKNDTVVKLRRLGKLILLLRCELEGGLPNPDTKGECSGLNQSIVYLALAKITATYESQ